MREAKKESCEKDQRLLTMSTTNMGVLDFLDKNESSPCHYFLYSSHKLLDEWVLASFRYDKMDLYLATLETIGGVL